MSEWKNFSLGDFCYFSRDKIKVSKLDLKNYISTENLLSNKGGIMEAASLPQVVTTVAFNVGDILVSNIRPYFKKIWRATFSGGCSNDVLAIRAKENIEPKFLYYVLSEDKFFDLVTATAKGTKMPRGDKKVIMNYPVPDFPLEMQKKIAAVLSAFDDKIELNNAINKNLEEQAQAIFKSWFIDFEPFGGTMPDDWRIGKVEDIIVFHDSKRIPLSANKRNEMEKIYPYYGATSIMDYVEDYIFDGVFLLFAEDGTVIDDKGFPILQYVEGKFWVNNHAHVLTGQLGFLVETLYLLFKTTKITSIITGAVQQKISQSNLKQVPVIVPSYEDLIKFDKIIYPMFEMIRNLRTENQKLGEIRDALLPRLMSGEINVSAVEI